MGMSGNLGWRGRILAAGLMAATADPALAQTHGGVIPEGIWVLNQTRSKPLKAGLQTLWVIKDDGKQMVWVSVKTSPAGEVSTNAWSGVYGGAPTDVVGTGMTTQIETPGPGLFHNFGAIKGAGTYDEDCTISKDGKRFVCHGKVVTPAGEQTWIDDFDWVAPSPDVPKT